MDNIDRNHADYSARLSQWQRVRDCLDGVDAVKRQRELYLPRSEGQSNTAYHAYVSRAAFFPVLSRTLRGLTGMVFRNQMRVTLPPKIALLEVSATIDGHPLQTFVERMVAELLSIGRYGILLDLPLSPDQNPLPYLAGFEAESIIDWQIDRNRTLYRLVLCENVDCRLELYLDEEGHYTIQRWVRVQGQFSKDGETAIVPLVAGEPLRYIPFIFINSSNLYPEIEKPPFLDMADINLGHYRNSADYETALYLTAMPTPYLSGNLQASEIPQAIGSGAFWILPEGATAGYLEFAGAGLEAQRAAMLDKERRLAALGAQMLETSRSRNETAETAKLRSRGETALLYNVINTAEAGLTMILNLATSWLTNQKELVEVKLNRDWVESRLAPQDIDALLAAWEAKAISRDTLLENLQRGEIIPATTKLEEEERLLDKARE